MPNYISNYQLLNSIQLNGDGIVVAEISFVTSSSAHETSKGCVTLLKIVKFRQSCWPKPFAAFDWIDETQQLTAQDSTFQLGRKL
jgi:hypothetical protein